jgi:hypothetical protein
MPPAVSNWARGTTPTSSGIIHKNQMSSQGAVAWQLAEVLTYPRSILTCGNYQVGTFRSALLDKMGSQHKPCQSCAARQWKTIRKLRRCDGLHVLTLGYS